MNELLLCCSIIRSATDRFGSNRLSEALPFADVGRFARAYAPLQHANYRNTSTNSPARPRHHTHMASVTPGGPPAKWYSMKIPHQATKKCSRHACNPKNCPHLHTRTEHTRTSRCSATSFLGVGDGGRGTGGNRGGETRNNLVRSSTRMRRGDIVHGTQPAEHYRYTIQA